MEGRGEMKRDEGRGEMRRGETTRDKERRGDTRRDDEDAGLQTPYRGRGTKDTIHRTWPQDTGHGHKVWNTQ